MSRNKRIILVVLFVMLDVFLLIGYLVIQDATMLNNLKKETNILSKLSVTTDRYNRKLKTRGNYAIVEESIKDYLDDYAVLLQDAMAIISDDRLTTILSYNNYLEDGPEFKKSFTYLEQTKQDFNKKIDSLIKRSEEDTIKDYINDKTQEVYYRDLYNKLMLDSDRKDEFFETKDLLIKTKTKVNNVLDVSYEVLNFLVVNKDSWKVEDGEIKFLTQDLYNQYMAYISKLTTK